jgi:exodeoxyribonuclease VII large subunit
MLGGLTSNKPPKYGNMKEFLKTEKVFTILELNQAVRGLIRTEFPEAIWVCGEIQDFRASRDKRHIYFNLVQKHPEADEIVAKLNVAIFENKKQEIFGKLKELSSDFALRNDIEVKLKCELDFYPRTGSFSLIVVDLDPYYTLGKLAQGRQKIIEDLRQRGLLEKNKVLKISPVPLRLGLITASDSAAYHDFIHELKISGFGFKVFLYNCYMQGQYVTEDVVGAINFFNKAHLELDVIALTRGGGSSADLSWFDSKAIAEAVSLSHIPVIAALGHEINVTVADMVAHTSVKTPTKAAQLLVGMVNEFAQQLDYLKEHILLKTKDYIDDAKYHLETIAVKFESRLPHYFQTHKEELLKRELSLHNTIKGFLAAQKHHLMQNFQLLELYVNKLFKNLKNEIQYKEKQICLLDPRNVLKRGYSITLKDKKALKSSEFVKARDMLRTILYKGSLLSEVKEKI